MCYVNRHKHHHHPKHHHHHNHNHNTSIHKYVPTVVCYDRLARRHDRQLVIPILFFFQRLTCMREITSHHHHITSHHIISHHTTLDLALELVLYHIISYHITSHHITSLHSSTDRPTDGNHNTIQYKLKCKIKSGMM